MPKEAEMHHLPNKDSEVVNKGAKESVIEITHNERPPKIMRVAIFVTRPKFQGRKYCKCKSKSYENLNLRS